MPSNEENSLTRLQRHWAREDVAPEAQLSGDGGKDRGGGGG